MFTFEIPGETTPRSYDNLGRARQYANSQAAKNQIEIQVVDTTTSQVAHIATYVEGRYFHPFERVETPAVPNAREFKGFIPAYQRTRCGAVVYRALDKSSWLVLDTNTHGRRLVATTKAACALTKAMNPANGGYAIPAGEHGEDNPQGI
jgi:hypothetical protein